MTTDSDDEISNVRCPCCDGTGTVRLRDEGADPPNRALQNAFAIVTANFEWRDALDKAEDSGEWSDVVAADAAENMLWDVIRAVLHETPSGTFAELGQLVGAAVGRVADLTKGERATLDLWREIAAAYQAKDWRGGALGGEDE